MELITVMTDASMRAVAHITRQHGIVMDDPAIDTMLPFLREQVRHEYEEILSMADGLQVLGEVWIKEAVNAGCILAAQHALQQAGLLTA